MSDRLRIYEVNADPDRHLCVQSPDLRYFRDKFDGRPMADGWKRPDYEVLNRSKKVADFTSWQIGRILLVSEKARGVLADVCPSSDLELLYFDKIKGVDLFALNVLRTEDYLDREHSDFIPGAGIPSRVTWKSGLPRELPIIFKVAGGSDVYASAALGRAALEHGLTGLRLADPGKNRFEQIVRREPINEFPGL